MDFRRKRKPRKWDSFIVEKKTRRKVNNPCGVCKRGCRKGVFCEDCSTWYHPQCAGLTKEEFRNLPTSQVGYACRSCRYNYTSALGRLEEATGKGISDLINAANSVAASLPDIQKPEIAPTYEGLDVEQVGSQLFSMYGGNINEEPLRVSADGNCLFNAVSLALFGNERSATELRLRTCVEMILNKTFYVDTNAKTNISLVSPDYDQALQDCARARAHSSAWTMHALSTVVKKKIVSCYPPVNGFKDQCIRILNCTFNPRSPCSVESSVDIMWTSTCSPQIGRIWIPNHFTVLVKLKSPEICQLDNSPVMSPPAKKQNRSYAQVVSETPTSSRTALHKTARSRKRGHEDRDEDIGSSAASRCEIDIDSLDDPLLESEDPCDSASDSREDTPSDMDLMASLLDDPIKPTVEVLPPTMDYMQDSFASDPEVSTVEEDLQDLGKPNGGQFMDVKKLAETLSLTKDAKCEIPPGLKENVTFVCDNSENIKRRKEACRSKFVDDCGVWGPGSTKKHYYWVNGCQYVYIEKCDGLYCKTGKGKRVPLEVQPTETDILLLKRYYVRLKRSSGYQKRVTWVEQFPSDMKPFHQSLAVVEYCGEFPKMSSVHSNAKKSTSEFIRTSSAVMDQVREDMKTLLPREIYMKHMEQGGASLPRDLKQIQNMKQTIRKPSNAGDRRNTADDLLTLLNSIHTNEFIQEVIQTKNKPPCIILYCKEQMLELKMLCGSTSNVPVVIGVDRTFNLGACFVTLLVFQHPNLYRKGTTTHPVMLGPLYLHWDGSYNTYHRFFSHIQAVLDCDLRNTMTQGSNLYFGSDEERALVKALKICFPESRHILCERHIEQNVNRHLRDIIGASNRVVQSVHNYMFGSSGLTNSKDECEFELNKMYLEDFVVSHIPKAKSYIAKSISTIQTDVFLPTQQPDKTLPRHWTNNACESMNNIFKLSTNWKSLKLPDLADKLHGIVKLQYADMRRALYGQGNNELTPWVYSFRVQHVCWTSKTRLEKDKHFAKFLRGKATKETTTVSSNGKLTIPSTPKTAKKPGQRKRIKNAKTVTR